MKSQTALILLSTYQGELYLAAQLESIIAQTHQNWLLLIRDDGSTDHTLDILQQYQQRDARITLTHDNHGNLKPAQSFSVLMKKALEREEPYIFFADQDDVWVPEKLALFIAKFEYMSNQHSNETPLLIFSDLCVVNEKLQTINPSYLKYEKLIPQIESPIHTLLVHNFVTGCAMAMNRALLQVATPVPIEAIMHDWWCALCVAVTGKMGFVQKATVLYRQHGKNDTGSKGFYGKIYPLSQLHSSLKRYSNSFEKRFSQAKKLAERLNKNNIHYQLISTYAGLLPQNRARRIVISSQLNLQPTGISRKIGLLLYLLIEPWRKSR